MMDKDGLKAALETIVSDLREFLEVDCEGIVEFEIETSADHDANARTFTATVYNKDPSTWDE